MAFLLSNNALFVEYKNNPFDELFRTGLNVSLSTDDPMQFHKTEEPLMEEYTVAKSLYQYSMSDLGEIARNSVVSSGFPKAMKWGCLGETWERYPRPEANSPTLTNVPMTRAIYRYEVYADRVYSLLWSASGGSGGSEELRFHSRTKSTRTGGRIVFSNLYVKVWEGR